VPLLRWIVAGLPQRPGFDPRSVHVRVLVEREALGQVFLLQLSVVRPSVSFQQFSR